MIQQQGAVFHSSEAARRGLAVTKSLLQTVPLRRALLNLKFKDIVFAISAQELENRSGTKDFLGKLRKKMESPDEALVVGCELSSVRSFFGKSQDCHALIHVSVDVCRLEGVLRVIESQPEVELSAVRWSYDDSEDLREALIERAILETRSSAESRAARLGSKVAGLIALSSQVRVLGSDAWQPNSHSKSKLLSSTSAALDGTWTNSVTLEATIQAEFALAPQVEHGS